MTLPIGLAEAKAQLRVDDDAQDNEIADFIQDAAAWVEDYTGHILEARDVVEHFRSLGPVQLRAWPIAPDATVMVAVDGAPIASSAVLDVAQRPARVRPAVGCSWPFADGRHPLTVTVRAGYEDPADVPRSLRRAMLVLISGYDADREGGEIFDAAEKSAQRLCRQFKRRTL